MAKYFAIIPNAAGEATRFPFKDWVRKNTDQLPDDFPKNGTTHEFKRPLIRSGWVEIAGIDTVFIIKPDANKSIDYANNYLKILDAEVEENGGDEEDAQELTFGLEKDLQQALRKNIQQLESGLEIIDGGRERHTVAGFIDITAKDALGRKVIIELKAPIAKPDVLAQTLAYMEAIQSEDGGEVRGIIIASDFVDRVRLAARQIPHLKLIRYAFQFNFNHVK